jgi:glyoxylase-like metal-dependent hydrolase (beta-lactamase superfamily II)
MQQLSPHLYLFEDTCNVYVITAGDSAVLIDFGAGAVLDHLGEIGVSRVSDVLMTHHHRDQGQGLPRARQAGIRIWVPHAEQELFHAAEAHWQAREILNNYNVRQDRFSLLESVAIDGTLQDYEVREFGGILFTVVPTPGHTIGSLTLMAEVDGQRVAFTGDLIAGPGQVWSLAATQWTYNGAEGVAASIASLLDVRQRAPDSLLPSHGEVMTEPAAAIDLLVERLWQLLQLRQENTRLFELRDRPYEPITPHLLRHRASMANTYVLLSESHKALMIDFGYDFMTGFTAGYDRASRRPWLYTIPALKSQFGIEQIEVVLPTHFHDDHVAGLNLLRRVEGAQVWAADLFADILAHPSDYDLPCLWYDPIPVDRVLPLETPIQWEEYTLTLYPLPGHTRYAVAVAFEVDGLRVLATGDQYQGDDGLALNYVYPNRFVADDYMRSAALYERLRPDLILTGHWSPLHVPPGYFGKLADMGSRLSHLHHDLLMRRLDVGDEDFLARIMPYQLEVPREAGFRLRVELRNPYPERAEAVVELMIPPSWRVTDAESGGQPLALKGNQAAVWLDAGAPTAVYFNVIPALEPARRRTRIAVDLTIGGRRFGEQAEALITTT